MSDYCQECGEPATYTSETGHFCKRCVEVDDLRRDLAEAHADLRKAYAEVARLAKERDTLAGVRDELIRSIKQQETAWTRTAQVAEEAIHKLGAEKEERENVAAELVDWLLDDYAHRPTPRTQIEEEYVEKYPWLKARLEARLPGTKEE